jgi:formate C-acetyltransferase
MTGKQLGPRTGEPDSFKTFDGLFAAYRAQFKHFLEIKLRGNHLIERMYATQMPAPFLSVLTDDCIASGRDYNAGGARYNNSYVQFVGLGSLTDSLSAVKQFCFDNAARNGTGTTRGPRVASGGPPDASSNKLLSLPGKPVSVDEAPGSRYSKRNLPHFEKPWAIYHITFSTTKGRKLAPEDRDIVLNCIRHWNERRYLLSAVCVMPDHVHMIIQPGIESQDPDGNPIFHSLTTILHTIKSFTAHEINKRTQSGGSLWEKESFDRYMRSDSDLEEKFHYVSRNPWDAGLVPLTEPYPWVWTPDAAGTTRGPRVASDSSPDAESVENGMISAGRRNQHAGRVCSPDLHLAGLVSILDADFKENEPLRQRLLHKTHKYGNDDDYADEITVRIFDTCFEALDGRPNTKGGHYRVEILPTTCHVYFGSVTGATPDGRHARHPLSEGISPVQGADRHGPTAVIKSAAKIDHLKTGGTLLNMKFTPGLVASDDGLEKWAHLVRSYFKMDGHHVQFNVVRANTLRQARAHPEEHRDLIVRVAGYSDYFCDLSKELQEEIIERTEHETFHNAGA